jgi:5-formyltetrahydrofolate cyclo-ligase
MRVMMIDQNRFCQNRFCQKELFRKKYLEIRRSLKPSRKETASKMLFSQLQSLVQKNKNILSYASKEDEINTCEINLKLCSEKSLFLPKVNGKVLEIYKVDDLNTLKFNNFLKIYEPDPKLCEKASLFEIDIVLVPGVCFNNLNQRIGFGGGFYDRLLSSESKTKTDLKTYGLCFKEQYITKKIPTSKLDVSLDKVFYC